MMASSSSTSRSGNHRRQLSELLFAASTNLSSSSSSQHLRLLFPSSPVSLASPLTSDSRTSHSNHNTHHSSSSSVKISPGKGGPAFVGQVFSMCDISGTGLMAVSTQFNIPFWISKRTPRWLKKMFAAVTKSERSGPVFRFFMDLGDAVSYVKQLNIASGVVGSCRLDIAYEHFKEKPDLFQFVPNEKQVKEANKLLKTLPLDDGNKKVEGVPVFGAQNLDIAIATNEGIKWYTPFFFDKSMLDNILEESVDEQFDSLIQSRDLQRRRDVVDDNVTADIVEEMGESMWEPPEVQEVLDEVGHPAIPFSVISKAAEIEFLYIVDRVLLGNRWLRKATGIQPKFPYMVDSFEKKSAASFLRAKMRTALLSKSEFTEDVGDQIPGIADVELKQISGESQGQKFDFRFPFGDWFGHPWSKQQNLSDTRDSNSNSRSQETKLSPFLPQITMVGISTGDAGRISKATIRKTMDDLTKELDRVELEGQSGSTNSYRTLDERDPLFVANVGEYFSGVQKTGPSRWVQGGSNF